MNDVLGYCLLWEGGYMANHGTGTSQIGKFLKLEGEVLVFEHIPGGDHVMLSQDAFNGFVGDLRPGREVVLYFDGGRPTGAAFLQ